ncbi:MAG: hypothetical protein WC593_04760 [Methanoregula sp.]
MAPSIQDSNRVFGGRRIEHAIAGNQPGGVIYECDKPFVRSITLE